VRYFASGFDSPPAALAELFGWAAGLALSAQVEPGFDDRPTADELRTPWPASGRPANLIPFGHQFGRGALFAALAVLGPAAMVLAGLAVFRRFH
jgi:hypothetical protein